MEKEIWIDARNHENYEVSNEGQIRRKKNGKILLQRNCEKDYKMVSLHTNGVKKTKRLARLIWESFNDCECKQTIDHIDRNKSNNSLGNLRCVSLSENCKNRTIYNKKNKYNLNDDIKSDIINKISSGEWTSYKAWKEYKVPTNYIESVVRRGTWDRFLNDGKTIQTIPESEQVIN